MSEFNSCASLMSVEDYDVASEKYHDLVQDGIDPFEHMLSMQYDLQRALAKKSKGLIPSPNDLLSIGEKFDWLRESKQAFDDEYREIIDALPGMSLPEKDRSAVWKRWKANYNDVRDRDFDDLTKDDLIELKFELCDAFHFFLNMFFALEMDAKDMFVYYYHKNAENHRRAQEGY